MICAFRVLNPCQWFLAKQSSITKFKVIIEKCQKQAKAERDGVIYPNITISNHFKHGKVLCSQTLRINRSRSENLATCALGYSLVHKHWHSPSSSNITRGPCGPLSLTWVQWTRQKFDIRMEPKTTKLHPTCFKIIAMHSICCCSLLG